MDRWQAKLLALFGSFLLPLIVTMLPYKVSGYVSKKGKKGKLVLSYLMCFGGGIFFGTYLLHMGPEVHLLLNTALIVPYGIQYPLANLFVGVGFFLVLFSEKFVLKWNKRRTRNRFIRKEMEEASMAAVAEAKAEAEAEAEAEDEAEDEAGEEAKTSGERNGATNVTYCCAACALGMPCTNPSGPNTAPVGFIELVMESDGSGFHRNGNGNGDSIHGNGVSCRLMKEGEEAGRNTLDSLVCSEPPVEDGDQHQHHHSTRSIILIIALSMHRIFEGMTIGLQGSVHNIWSLFVAVMCHELVIGFSLGLQLVKSRLSLRRMSVTSFVCSVIMPLGVAIGIGLTELGGEDDALLAMANGILQAIAMGTFIYVTFFEILQEEVDPNDTSLGKISFIFAGFVMMALLVLIPEETPATLNTTQQSLMGNASATATPQTTVLADVSLAL